LRNGDVRRVGAATTRNFQEPIQTIIPWATNYFTETLIGRVSAEFGKNFWGFWMLGGMSGGGMGFIFAPESKPAAQQRLQVLMSALKLELQHALPFAMEPVVYDFAINERGTYAELLADAAALMPAGYYTLLVPGLLRQDPHSLSTLRRAELDKFGRTCRTRPELSGVVQTFFDVMLPRGRSPAAGAGSLPALLKEHGFDRVQHEQIRVDLKEGRIGLAQNRLPTSAVIEDVRPEDVVVARAWLAAERRGAGRSSALPEPQPECAELGAASLRKGEVGVVTLAAGAGSRWTQGAGVVKALHPFCKLGGRHRTFIETHLAKSNQIARQLGTTLPHVFTTSYLTHAPTEEFLARQKNYDYEGPLLLSPGRSVGWRLIPTVRDLRFLWEEMPQQVLDEQHQKVRDSLRHALIHWAEQSGEASDYTDNLPLQCLHPVGHWFEVPNLFRNGVLERLLKDRPQLKFLMLHNIDTLGADVDPALLGLHIRSGAGLTFEMITRRLEDRGGGLARVNGRVRLVEGLAMPREDVEFELSYYNSNTCWIDLDKVLTTFALTREDIVRAAQDTPEGHAANEKIAIAVRGLAAKMPTYITLKEVKKRWGQGQEDVFPVTQFEKLWVDMTALPEIESRFVVVPRLRGQQLKDQAQLDGWLRDGSAAYVENLCGWR
jgi:hypothetical protein